jgi:predicted amidohydrolase
MDVLLGQLIPSGDVVKDATCIADALGQNSDASLAIFPELFIGGYEVEDPDRVAIDPDGPELAAISESCARQGIAAVFGFTERLGNSSFANSAACFDRRGQLAGIYRKTHLFGAKEQLAFEPGRRLILVDLADTRVGLMICFDMEFPETSRLLAVNGAQLLVTLSANMAPYASDHRIAARARALDNRLPHVYVNRLGNESGIEFVGDSCVISPNGYVQNDIGFEEGVFNVSINFDRRLPPEVNYLKQLKRDLVVSAPDEPLGGGNEY